MFMSNFLLKINLFKVSYRVIKSGEEILHTKDINIPDRQFERSSKNHDSFSVKSRSLNLIYTVFNIQKACISSTCVNKYNGVSCAVYVSIYISVPAAMLHEFASIYISSIQCYSGRGVQFATKTERIYFT